MGKPDASDEEVEQAAGRSADQILVLNHAHIVQRGTHAEQVRQEGLYADFVTAKQEAIGWKLAQ